MSAVAIVRELLATWPALTALVPPARIIAGPIQEGTALPAVGVTEISVYAKQQSVSRSSRTETVSSRVQVTVLTNNDYPMMKRILLAAKRGGGVHTGMIKGYQVNSVIPTSVGPEMPVGTDKIYEQSRDFIVVFAEPN